MLSPPPPTRSGPPIPRRSWTFELSSPPSHCMMCLPDRWGRSAFALRSLHGVSLQVFEIDEFQNVDMGRFQIDGAGDARLEGFLPPSDADAPLIARPQTGEPVLREGRAEIVA